MSDFSSLALILGGTLFLLSLLANIYWLVRRWRHANQTSLPPPEHESERVVSDIVKYLEKQGVETKAFLLAEAIKGQPTLNNKTVALRTAYLNIERRALGYGESTWDYWEFINRRLLKLLETFMPQLFGRDSQIQELESRVALLKQRIKAMAKGDQPALSELPIQTLDKFLEENREAIKHRPDIAQYLSKMENSVQAFESPELRSLQHCSEQAQRYALNTLEALNKLHRELDNQMLNIECLDASIPQVENAGEAPLVSAGACEKNPNAEWVENHFLLKQALREKKQDNEKLRMRVAKLKQQVAQFDALTQEKKNQSILAISNDSSKIEDAHQALQHMQKLSMDIAEQTHREVQRLRELLGRQNSSIEQLDTQLATVQGALNIAESSAEEKDKLIEKLRTNLADSNFCITTLEQQLNDFRHTMHALKTADTSLINQQDMDALNQELTRFKSELDQAMRGNTIKAHILEFISQALQASSLEDLAVLLFHQLDEFGCDPAIELFYGDKTLCISASGKISSKDHMLVENMHVNEINVSDKGQLVRFRMRQLKGVLRSQAGNTQTFQDNNKTLLEMLQATDKLVEKIGATQQLKNHKKQVALCQNTIKKVALEVDQRFDQQSNHTKSVVVSSVGQLQDIARTAGLQKAKVEAFSKIQEESLQALEVGDALRVKTRESFLALIRSLESA